MAGEIKGRMSALYDRFGAIFYGALVLILLLCILFAGEDVGLSNNGDFQRVMFAASLSVDDPDYAFRYVDTYRIELTEGSAAGNGWKILFGGEGLAEYLSVHVFVVRISVLLNLLVNKIAGWDMTVYHLGVLGCIYAVLYAAVLGFLLVQFRLRKTWKDIAVKLLVILVLCDVGYVSYFNSLYGEALQHIALVFCAAMLIRIFMHPPTWRDAIWCAVGAVTYGWAKFFNIPVALLLLLAMEGTVAIRMKKWTPAAVGAAAAALLMGIYLAIPTWMDNVTSYNAVFYGAVKDTDAETAAVYLEDLGLPAEMADYRSTNYYVSWVPGRLEADGYTAEVEGVSKFDLLRFYLMHPARAAHQAEISAMHCGMIRPYYLSDFGDAFPRLTFAERISLWSRARNWLPFDTIFGNLAVIAAFAAVLVVKSRGRLGWRRLVLLLGMLLVSLAYLFLAPVMFNGEGDLAKHLFAFVEVIDLLFLALLVLAISADSAGQDGKIPRAVGVLLLAALLLPGGWNTAAGQFRARADHGAPEVGAYVAYGTYGGQTLNWLITACDGETATLFCTDIVACRTFDVGNSNAWTESTLRRWLQGEFLAAFDESALAYLRTTSNTVLLTAETKMEAESGNVDFFCSHIPALAGRGYTESYRKTAEDLVMLPDIDMLASLTEQGYSICGDAAYWLETPYYSNGYMVRCAAPDGYIYFAEADTERGVRPVVTVSLPQTCAGTGRRSDPFVFA